MKLADLRSQGSRNYLAHRYMRVYSPDTSPAACEARQRELEASSHYRQGEFHRKSDAVSVGDLIGVGMLLNAMEEK